MKKLQILSKVSKKVTALTGRTGLKISKYSPEILIVGGVIGIVASTIFACTATLKLESVVDAAQETITRIHAQEKLNQENYSLKDANKDLYITYVQTGVKIGKLYLPAVTLGVLSIGAILYSYKILSRRNIALMAAYKGVEEAFNRYRQRVIADAGVDKDREYKYGVKKLETTEMAYTDEDGVKHKAVKNTIEVVDGKEFSQYARLFDELTSINWSKTPSYNLTFLNCQQRFANDLLQSRGHIFLSEVYDMLGFERDPASIVVGWVKGVGDDYIDFGVYDEAYAPSRDFVSGREKCILLDFNVAGVVYDQI